MTIHGVEVKRVCNTFNLTRFRKVERNDNELPIATQRELNKIFNDSRKKMKKHETHY